MVEEMACKRGFVGKRTEPVVRRHLAAPYIFLSFFLPSSLSPSSSRRHHGSSPSCCSPPSQHFHLYLPSYVSPFPLHIQILRPTLIRLLNFPITYQPRNPVILSLLSRSNKKYTLPQGVAPRSLQPNSFIQFNGTSGGGWSRYVNGRPEKREKEGEKKRGGLVDGPEYLIQVVVTPRHPL